MELRIRYSRSIYWSSCVAKFLYRRFSDQIPFSKLYKVTCWIFVHYVFDIARWILSRETSSFHRQKLRNIFEKPVNRIETSRRYQIDSGINIRNANPSSPTRRIIGARLRAPLDWSRESMMISRSIFKKPGSTRRRSPVSLFTPHREMYTNELVINFSMADGATARPRVSTGSGSLRVVFDRWDHWRIASRFAIGISWLFCNITRSRCF